MCVYGCVCWEVEVVGGRGGVIISEELEPLPY